MTWAIPHDVAWCESATDGKVWTVCVRTGQILGLEPSAFAIWQQADGERAADDVAKKLAESQGWDLDEIAATVSAFMDQLCAIGLLEQSGSSQ